MAILTKCKQELQLIFGESKEYSRKYRYEIHPAKTNVIAAANEHKVDKSLSWTLGENSINISDSAVHLGTMRLGKIESSINVDERISLARRTSYSLMNTGLHGSNALTSTVSYQIYKTYVIPWLLYGSKILPFTKSQIEIMTSYHLRTLRNLQSLPQRTSNSVVYMLLGALPMRQNCIRDS